MEGSRIAKKILALLLVAVIALGCGFGGAVLAAKYYNQPGTAQAQAGNTASTATGIAKSNLRNHAIYQGVGFPLDTLEGATRSSDETGAAGATPSPTFATGVPSAARRCNAGSFSLRARPVPKVMTRRERQKPSYRRATAPWLPATTARAASTQPTSCGLRRSGRSRHG